MVECNFCGKEIPRGTGKLFIQKDGKALRFCASKCQKNMLVHNKKSQTRKWTKAYGDLKKSSGVSQSKAGIKKTTKAEKKQKKSKDSEE